MDNRVMVTGGTGFIGRELCQRLADVGYEVVVLSRDVSAGRAIFPGIERIEVIGWDGKTSNGWEKAVERTKAVVNLAGESIVGGPWTQQKKQRIRDSRLDTGAAVMEAIRKAQQKPAVLIQASAIGIYGNCGDTELDESHEPGEGFLADVVKDWEASTQEAEELGIRRAVVRLGVVLGREGGMIKRLSPLFRAFAGGVPGNGQQWFSWIHINDAVAAIRFMLENGQARGVYNLTAPESVRMKIFCRSLGKCMHRPGFLPIPALALRLVLGEMADEVLLASQRVIPKRVIEAGFHFSYPEINQTLLDIVRN